MSEAALIPTWELHHRLRRSLEVAQVTNQEMADFLGVHENTVRNYLAGRSTPSRATIRVWASRCGVDLDWLKASTRWYSPLPALAA